MVVIRWYCMVFYRTEGLIVNDGGGWGILVAFDGET